MFDRLSHRYPFNTQNLQNLKIVQKDGELLRRVMLLISCFFTAPIFGGPKVCKSFNIYLENVPQVYLKYSKIKF